MGKEYTIKQAAEILEVSKSTVRRRIKSGKIEAELKQSPYGEQYFIPEEELNQAVKDKEVVDVKEVSQPIDKEQFLNELTEAIKDDINGDMDKVKENINETIKNQNKQLQQDIQGDIQKLTQEVQKLRKEQNKSFWQKIKNLFKIN